MNDIKGFTTTASLLPVQLDPIHFNRSTGKELAASLADGAISKKLNISIGKVRSNLGAA